MTTKPTQKNIPELRFPGFSGEWEEVNLSDVADVKGGKRIPKGYTLQSQKNKHPYITVSDMKYGSVVLDYLRYVPDEVFPYIKSYTVGKDDLYVTVAGTLGHVGIIPNELDGANLTENADKITNLKCNKLFLLYLLNTNVLKKLVKATRTESAQPKLAIYALNSLKLSFPQKKEQQKIADFLIDVDTLLNNLKEQKDKLEEYKRGMMQKIFSQEVRFKDDDGKDFPEWENCKFGEIAKFLKGSPLSKADIVKDGKNKCIHYGELFTKYKETISNIKSRTNIEISKSELSKTNDVLMPTSDVTPNGLATASAIKEEGVVLGGDVLIIRPDRLNNVFLAYYISAHKKDVMRLVQGVTVYHLYGSHLSQMKIQYPCPEEQLKIANFLVSLDALVEAKSKQIKKAETWKKGLLQKMFV